MHVHLDIIMTMTAEELKKFLAPDTFDCKMCKKPLATEWEARQCEHRDRIAQQEAEEKLRKQKEAESKGAEKLQKALEANLT